MSVFGYGMIRMSSAARIATIAIVQSAIAVWLMPTGSVHGAEPGAVLEVPLPTDSGGKSVAPMRLRFCPSGTIRAGRPASGADESKSSPDAVGEFYLAETEITLEQLRQVVPDALGRIIDSAVKTSGSPELAEIARRAGSEPAFYVEFRDAVRYCRVLQQRVDAERAATPNPSVERRLFRLPSHVEWQYAARAIREADAQHTRPHFARWAPLSSLPPANRQKCNEIWKALGKGDACPDTQEAFLVMSGTTDPDAQAKLKEVLAEVFAKAFGTPARSVGGTGKLEPASIGEANDWGLRGLHEGVSEYAVWARQTGRTRQVWQQLSAKADIEKGLASVDDLFLCGGSFVDPYFSGGDSLARFTVWGGPRLDGGQPAPIRVDADTVFELMPGFRVLMERELAPDWLLLVRRAAIRNGSVSSEALAYLRPNSSLVNELTPPGDSARTVLRFYSNLCEAANGGNPMTSRKVSELATAASAAQRPSGAGAKLAGRLGSLGDPKTSSKKTESDDTLFFSALSTVLP